MNDEARDRLQKQVDDLMTRHEARKTKAAKQAEEAAQQGRRACLKPEAEAQTPAGLADAILSRLTAGVVPVEPAQELSKAWDTIIADELIRNRIPDRYRYEITDWGCQAQERVFRALMQLLVGVGATVALIGLRGTGKTTLVSQVVIKRAWQDYRTIYVAHQKGAVSRWMPYRKMADLIARFKPLYADFGSVNSEELIAARESLCRADLLIIDELHECEDQKMKDRMLPDIIDRRYAKMKDTVVIANQSEEEFTNTTSDSILSRIEEHGMIIPCQWGSFRAKDSGLPKPRHAEH